MPLKSCPHPINEGPNLEIHFRMYDGSKPVHCRVTHESLADTAGTSGIDGDLKLFEQYRERIERAASKRYDAGKVEADGSVVVTRF